MANKPGRNQPCPCGSGRKYKNCCLAADEARERASRAAALSAPPALGVDDLDDYEDDLDEELDEELDDELSGFYPEVAAAPTAADELWERFEAADYEEQIAIFQAALAAGELDDELAFEMLSQIQPEAQARDEPRRFRDLVEQLAREAPAVYAEDAVYYVSWLLDEALASGDLDRLPTILEPFAREPDRAIDELFRVVDQFLYYGHTAPLVDMLRRGWERVAHAPGIHPQAIADYGDRLVDVVLFDYLATAPAPRADDAALLALVTPYLELQPESFRQNVAALLGELGRDWHPRDFESPPRAEPRERRLTLLGWEWLGDLWRRHGVPLGRGKLAADALVDYQTQQPGKGKSAEHLLVPAPRRLDRLLTSYVDLFDYRVHRVGALVELLPLYLGFLAERRLVDARRAAHALAALRPVQEAFLEALVRDQEDPPLVAAIHQRWAEV